MGELERYLAAIEGASSPPRWAPGALRAAWDACEDVQTMIAVLRRGGAMGVFEVDSVREGGRDGVVEHWLFRLRSAGRYYRIDVHREGGAQALRRCFPDFPDEWAPLLEDRLDVMPPLERLRSDLANGRPPRIDADTDRAWASCKDPTTLLLLLRELGHAADAQRLAGALPPMPRGGMLVPESWKREALAVVLAEFPRVPPHRTAGG